VSEDFDYVIVGSGAGGASAARVLADVNGSIAIVEEGPAVSTDQFQDRALPTFKRLYRGMGAQATGGRAPMLVIQGRCVGGSTVVNSAIMRRLPEEVWREWDASYGIGDAIPYEEVVTASAAIERELHAEPTPEAIWGGNNGLLNKGAATAGVAGAPTLRNTRGCRGSARCNLGCPHGAKQSMQLSYLPYAEQRGARLISDRRVERVLMRGARAVGVQTAAGDLMASKAVLVAASAVQTPGVLWRSGVRSRHLGRHFQGHPGMAIVGLFDTPVRMGDGATQGFEVDGWRSESRVKLETLALPPETFFSGMPGIGRRWASLMAEFARAAVWVLPLRSQGEGAVGVGWRDGRLKFRLDPRDLPNLRRGLRLASELMFAAGAREVVCPVDGLPDRLKPDQLGLIEGASDDPARYPLALSHLFGTARMSGRPEDGVVGHDFQVHGTENLYVVDSSVFPTNLGVNPQVTIMALARLAAQRMLS
jgi:choline dehydrogenase-like flavoprotein